MSLARLAAAGTALALLNAVPPAIAADPRLCGHAALPRGGPCDAG
jgi:hypothetical protein